MLFLVMFTVISFNCCCRGSTGDWLKKRNAMLLFTVGGLTQRLMGVDFLWGSLSHFQSNGFKKHFKLKG